MICYSRSQISECTIFPKHLSDIYMTRFWPTFWWRDSKVYLIFSVFASRPNFLLTYTHKWVISWTTLIKTCGWKQHVSLKRQNHASRLQISQTRKPNIKEENQAQLTQLSVHVFSSFCLHAAATRSGKFVWHLSRYKVPHSSPA
jgi:hypothetical protein